MLSSPADVEVAVYPDSGKVGVFASAGQEGGESFRLILPQDAAVDYFQGEE